MMDANTNSSLNGQERGALPPGLGMEKGGTGEKGEKAYAGAEGWYAHSTPEPDIAPTPDKEPIPPEVPVVDPQPNEVPQIDPIPIQDPIPHQAPVSA
jgi:hypothetical protein